MYTPPFEITVITTKEEFVSLQPEWEQLMRDNQATNFYLSFEWFYSLLFLTQRPPVEELYILTVRSDGQVVGILPLGIVQRRLRIFRFRILEIIGNIYSPLRGCIVKRNWEQVIVETVMKFLLTRGKADWDLINFEGVSPSDPFALALRKTVSDLGMSLEGVDQFVNVVSDLSSFRTAEEYFQSLSKNLRQTIRTGINKMNREGRFEIVLTMQSNQDVQLAMERYYTVYRQSYSVVINGGLGGGLVFI